MAVHTSGITPQVIP